MGNNFADQGRNEKHIQVVKLSEKELKKKIEKKPLLPNSSFFFYQLYLVLV